MVRDGSDSIDTGPERSAMNTQPSESTASVPNAILSRGTVAGLVEQLAQAVNRVAAAPSARANCVQFPWLMSRPARCPVTALWGHFRK